MNNPNRLNQAALSRLDDLQLESVRYDMLHSCDERYEQVVEHLLVRGITTIERIARDLCESRGVSAGQIRDAVIDASVRLQLRLTRDELLPSIETLATQIAQECVAAIKPGPEGRPRLASRAPQLRTVEVELNDALRTGRLPRRGGSFS